MAKKQRKPLIALEPWHSSRTLPQLFGQVDLVLKWHGKQITDAIRKHGH